MQFVLFTLVGIALYYLADRALLALERRAGRVFEHRTMVFFAILLALALTVFTLIQRLAPGP